MPNDNDKQQNNKSSFAQMEERILDFWGENNTFQKSVDKEAPQGDFVFYDGPPFATGLPHYGHLVANIMKDVVPRYWTMKGYRVERRWGWDCHGLPLENLAEEELGLKTKQDIEDKGIQEFNEYCRSMVLRYAGEWQKIIRRLARWVDMENSYRTMDPDYMESIWWVFQRLWQKGLIYKGYKSMHICPRCGTTLSNFEVGLGYKDIKDMAATAKFELEDEPGTYLLAWTTTPWTLIGNVALAVGEDIDYVEVNIPDDFDPAQFDMELDISPGKYIFAKEAAKGGEDNISKTLHKLLFLNSHLESKQLKGKDLAGKRYKPLFPYYAQDENLENRENGWQVYAADFVTTEEGTGIVHIAPAFGEDDMNLGREKGLPFVQHVDKQGRFQPEVKDFAGMEAKPKDDHQSSDVEIIKYLAYNGLLFHKEKYEHSYPHCWRCDTPLLNYATDSWFVEVTQFRDQLAQNNQNVNWVPEHLRDGRFGKWLEQARDWAISRDRYWGAPLPVWECESCGERKIIGSRQELEDVSGEKVEDLHKHFVDEISFACEECGGQMKRIPEVLDCWFESGAMPYGQFHYPFENKEKFENNFPAEFVAEGIDQTRGWFYTLMALSTALFQSEAFKNVVTNGIVLAEDGAKMSKSKKNYPDPVFVFDAYSVDAVRYYLLSSPVVTGENLNFSEDGVKDVLRRTAMTVWNVYKFYSLFTEDKDIPVELGGNNILDQWIVSRLNQLIEGVTHNMDNYLLPKATRPMGEFIDDLSTWYLRRSRDRFKSGEDQQDKDGALATTGYVLHKLSRVMAPVMPFIAEEIWQKVTGNDYNSEKSVHLQSWPEAGDRNEEVLNKMAVVREIVEAGLAKRDEAGIKVRQPLSKLSVKNENEELSSEYLDLVKDEVNVKEIEVIAGKGAREVELDINITPELEQEGIKREIVRYVNALRKNASLTIQDRVDIHWESDSDKLNNSIKDNSEDIKKSTLADSIQSGEVDSPTATKKVNINNESATLYIVAK